MNLPREVCDELLAESLRRFDCSVTSQAGSHMRLTSTLRNFELHATVPLHAPLEVGAFAQILADVAVYLGISRDELILALFQ